MQHVSFNMPSDGHFLDETKYRHYGHLPHTLRADLPCPEQIRCPIYYFIQEEIVTFQDTCFMNVSGVSKMGSKQSIMVPPQT